jgi:hypothetical protein
MTRQELERRLRPLGRIRQRRRRPLARRLRHRFPDPRARARLRRAALGFDIPRSIICATYRRQRRRSRRRRGRAARLCALRAGAQRPAGDRRSALSRRHQARHAFKTPLAQAQIAAALAMLGDRARAGGCFRRRARDAGGRERTTAYSRPDYGSRLRDGAALLALLAEANLSNGEVAGDPIARAAPSSIRRAPIHLHQHAGEQLARARRRSLWPNTAARTR